MGQPIKYVCSCCGQTHEKWPALTFKAPSAYHALSSEEKSTIATCDTDFCLIRHPNQTDRFIRAVLLQKVIDHCDCLDYGLWVSLSEKSYDDYSANFNNEQHQTQYFGWLNNMVPGYTFDKAIPTIVITKLGTDRPEIIPDPDFDHPFVQDYYKGISKAEAERRIREMLGTSTAKPRWKFW